MSEIGADKESLAFGVRAHREGEGTEETEGEARTDARRNRVTESQAAQVFPRLVFKAQGRM